MPTSLPGRGWRKSGRGAAGSRHRSKAGSPSKMRWRYDSPRHLMGRIRARRRLITCSRHPFPEECPWEAGPEDHIQVDLADADNTQAGVAEIKRRLEGGQLHALVNNAAISPKADGGTRLGAIETTAETW